MADRPKPYLTRERTNELLEVLGFEIHGTDCLYCGYPANHIVGTIKDTPQQRLRFSALMELIAGGIAEWADVEPEEGETSWESINTELEDFAQEWLVG